MIEDTISENTISRLGRQLNVRNRDELDEVVTGVSPLELKQQSEETQKRMRNIQIETRIEEKLSPEQQLLLDKTREFAQMASIEFQDKMREAMDLYGQKNTAFTEEIKQKMCEKGYDLPQFTIYGKEDAEEFLSDVKGTKHRVLKEDSFLLVFNLPTPIARYWYKGGMKPLDPENIEPSEGNIEWGYFYRESLSAIHEFIGREEYEEDINLERINDNFQHDPKKFYYIWEVSENTK